MSDEPIGGVGEEAAKLLGALSDWARDHGPDLGSVAGQAAHVAQEINEHVATGSAECAYCPVCRTVHAVRSSSPELRAHLVQAATSFLQAATIVVGQLAPPEGADGAPNDSTKRSHNVEHIDLDGDGK